MPCSCEDAPVSYISDYELKSCPKGRDAGALAVMRQRAAAHNQAFVACEVVRHRAWFDTVEKTPLTTEQCVAAVAMEDRNLLVAAAGSGKTSTMVGKVGYALLTGSYTPANILVLAFNHKAAQELGQRLRHRLHRLIPPGQRINTKTFHALGLEIITAVQGRRPCMDATANTADPQAVQLKELIRHHVHHDADFAQEWMLFRLFYCRDVRDPSSFPRRRQWEHFVRTHGNGYGRRTGFLTFNGELVGNQCQQAVANWLFMYGFAYEYKKRSPDRWSMPWSGLMASGFLLTGSQTWIDVGTHQRCRAPKGACGNYPTVSVSFADFVGGRLYLTLRQGLLALGLPVHPSGLSAVIQRLGDQPSPDELLFLVDFIKHARSNSVNVAALETYATRHPQRERAGVLLGFLTRVLTVYVDQFKRSGQLDFPQMLSLAREYVTDGRYVHPYTLILVDEFQDTSQASASLLLALLHQAPACKLFAVGDDWQSIYRFAGADNRLFTEFSAYFGTTATSYLTASFRFNQGIADIAAKFVQQNPQQLKKQVRAQDSATQDAVLVCSYRTNQEMDAACEASMADIQAAVGEGGATVYVLARYRHQQPAALHTWQERYAGLNIQFMTIHAAKGLEADYVLVLGLHAGRHAFPARIASDPLLQLVMPASEGWPDAEERRVLYVAITRARHKVYLMANANQPSDFVTELAGYPGVNTRGQPSG